MDRAQAFYQGLFDWNFQDFMGGEMRIFGTGETHIGGLMLVKEVNPGRSPSLWFKVASLQAAMEKVIALGGEEASPATPVPGVGFSCQAKDPDGNYVGLVEYTE